MKRFLRITLAVGFVLAVLLVVGGVWAWRRASEAPAWYAPLDPADAETAALAERVEYGIVEEFHRIRPDDEAWTLRIREQQMNAWLAARLSEWVEHDPSASWPESFGTPQIRLGPEGLDLAVEVRGDGAPRVLVTRLAPRVEDGKLAVDVARFGVGQLEVPGQVLDILEAIAPDGVIDQLQAERLFSMLLGGGKDSAVVELADGRRVELLRMRYDDGALDLTNRTLPPPQP